jgi:hypothetical protein
MPLIWSFESMVKMQVRPFVRVGSAIALAGLSAVVSATVAGAAIVGGTLSGTWQTDNTGNNPAGLQVGDPFTAEYTYDDTQVLFADNSNPGFTIEQIAGVDLLSFVLTLGSNPPYSFDLTPGIGSASLLTSFFSDAPSGGVANVTAFLLSASSIASDPGNNIDLEIRFDAFLLAGQDSQGSIRFSSAQAAIFDLNADDLLADAETENVTFSGTAPIPIPTPALLPGLLGLGMAAWRKGRRESLKSAGD